MGKSAILVVGATGEIGKFIAEASVKLGHPTFMLVRPSGSSASDPRKKELLAEFERLGVVSLHGGLSDHASLVAALLSSLRLEVPRSWMVSSSLWRLSKEWGTSSGLFHRSLEPTLTCTRQMRSRHWTWFLRPPLLESFELLAQTACDSSQAKSYVLQQHCESLGKKLGHSLHKTFVPEAEVQKRFDGSSPSMANFGAAATWELVSGRSVFPLGPNDVDPDGLYPDYKCVTVDEYLDNFIEKK